MGVGGLVGGPGGVNCACECGSDSERACVSGRELG